MPSIHLVLLAKVLPAILDSDATARAILFEHVEGEHAVGLEVDSAAVRAMASFIVEINAPASRSIAGQMTLPSASESGSRPADHLRSVRERIHRLLTLPGRNFDISSMQDWVRDEVQPVVDRWAESHAIDMLEAATLPIFSPSDFGFHNVLVRRDGRFCFLDFEHAGWDDPAKLCADFALQPESPLPVKAINEFVQELIASGVVGPDIVDRTRRIMPIQAAKWTTIVLNPFMNSSAAPTLQAARFAKARAYWNSVLPSV